MMLDGNLDLHKRMENIGNCNFVDKYNTFILII